jgi:predicted enzyme related to lactoylglutathione lyase
MAAIKVVYLYVGSDDVDADLKFFVDGLGGEQAWRFHEFDADVAGVRMGDGPMYIVANHRPAGSLLPIIAVDNLDATATDLKAAGFSDLGTTVEVPDGPVMVLRAPAGNEVGLMHQVRPGALEHH